MNIVMMTNTYLPHVGGVAQSVQRFVEAYRSFGHRVLVVAPEFEDQPDDEVDVVRVAAIQHFNGSDFAVSLPVVGGLKPALDAFEPDIIHSHHPFLLGDTAIRVAASWQRPLVFTHHTMYEQYVHYVPLDAPRLKEFAVAMVTAYGNQSDHVIAPSASVAEIIRERGIETPISVVPTGVDTVRFRQGDGAAFRRRHSIPDDAYVVGHVGRLAPEKNLPFLSRAVARACASTEHAWFLVVGSGPSAEGIKDYFKNKGLSNRLIMAGVQKDGDLVDAYHAMNVFAFSSYSETQGMVLTEAMAAGVPVVALDAPGVREVVDDGRNGRLLFHPDPDAFARALTSLAALPADAAQHLRDGARETGDAFSIENCARKALDIYASVLDRHKAYTDYDESTWGLALNTLREEWQLWSERLTIATEVFLRDFTLLADEDYSWEGSDSREMVLMVCPHCARELKIARHYVGHTGKCNHCGGALLVDPNRVEEVTGERARSAPAPDTSDFPYDFDEQTLWLWVQKEIRRKVPLHDIVECLREREQEYRAGTELRDIIESLRRQLYEGMAYRNWRGRALERRGAYADAAALYEENVRDHWAGYWPYDRLRILYARRNDYDNAARVCRQFLQITDEPAKAERFRRYLRGIERKRRAQGGSRAVVGRST